VGTGPWDVTRAGTPGRNRFLASDADRDRAIDVLKAAFVGGALTKDELAVRTGQVLASRTYGQLAAITGDLAPQPAPPAKPASPAKPAKPAEPASPASPAKPKPATKAVHAPARRRLGKKVVALSACAIILLPALGASFFTFYGGFLVMFLFTFIGTVVTSTPPGKPQPGPAPMSGRR
jgi:hypothetical protein